MRPDKSLTVTSDSKNYKNENEFEHVIVYLPLEYDGKNILDYTLKLNVSKDADVKDVITLTQPDKIDDQYEYVIPIPLAWTKSIGRLSFMIEFSNNYGVVGYTNEAYTYIYNSKGEREYPLFQPDSVPSIKIVDDYWIVFGKSESTGGLKC